VNSTAVVLAVFFVWCEVLFGLGYKPELHKRLQNRIGKAVYEYRKENAQKAKSS
jgi:2-hydroxy fatty acid dioxygenase